MNYQNRTGPWNKARGRELLRYIREFQADHGFSPSGDEIAADMELSRTYAYYLLSRMEEEGLIERPRPGGRAMGRNIRIARGAMKALDESL